MSDWENSEINSVVSASFRVALQRTLQKGGMDALEGVFKALLKKLSVPEHIVEDTAFHVFFRVLLPLTAHAVITNMEDSIDQRYGELTSEKYAMIAEDVFETMLQEFGVDVLDMLKQYASVFLGSGVAEKFIALADTSSPQALDAPSNLTTFHIPQVQKVVVPAGRE